jgi:hypothetical protein
MPPSQQPVPRPSHRARIDAALSPHHTLDVSSSVRTFILMSVLASLIVGGRVADSAGMPQCHPTVTRTIRTANLDTDRAREEIAATNVSCAHDYSLSVIDQCLDRRQSHWLRGMGRIERNEIVEANARSDGRELFYVLRRGPGRAPDLGTAALVHLSRLHSNRCPMPRFLFTYRGDDPLIPPPRGSDLAAFDVSIVELSRRYRGKEIRLVETFAVGAAETQRTTLLRYSAMADRYLIYSPKL